MMDFLNSFKSLVKSENTHIDNNVFRLHYKFTVIMLIVFSILLTSKQYFGDPIECQVSKDKAIINAYCWIYGTYVNQRTLTGNGDIPGLGHTNEVIKPWDHSENNQIIWQQYYQWVCIVFCFQALLFYLPRYLWKTWEGGRLKLLVGDFSSPLLTSAWNPTTKNQLVNYILTGVYYHKWYAARYIFCEVLNLCNVVLQIFLTNWFLGDQFYFYGIDVIGPSEVNPLNKVFPKVTKCQYYNYGPSGTIQNYDALCVLPLNILNEKLFIVLWFWLFFLTLVTVISLIYRSVVILIPRVRLLLLMAQARSVNRRQANLIIERFSYGDFFVLYYIGKNVNPIIFRELVGAVSDTLKIKNPYSASTGFEVNI